MPWPTTPPTAAHRAAYADAEPRSFWLAQPDEPTPALTGAHRRRPLHRRRRLHRPVGGPVREGARSRARRRRCSRPRPPVFGASGRNGGFAVASLTHGIENGLARFADEMPVLERLALENFAGLRADLDRHGIDCDFEPTGELLALTDAYQEPWLEEEHETLHALRARGHACSTARRCAPRSPHPPTPAASGTTPAPAILDPGKLAAGLRDAAIRAGVRVYEHSAVHHIGDDLEVLTAAGRVRARRVLLATSAYPPLLREIRRYVVPVYDYVLVTEPLDRPARSAGATARASATAATSSTTTGSPPTTGSSTAAGTRSTATAAPSAPPRRARRDVRDARPALLPHVPAARGHALHPPLGRRDRHLVALLASSSAPRRQRSPTRPATPASASPPPASAAAPRSTCSTAATPRPRACATCAPSRSRSRPSRCARR